MKRTDDANPVFERANRVLGVGEELVYVLVATLLTGSALVLVGYAGYELVAGFGERFEQTVEATLDTLLLVFVLVELLSAVRATMQERRLVAEPFLLVGIIVSIKEIIVTAIGAQDALGQPGDAFEDAMLEIGVLGALLLSLSVSTFLMRRKEREPDE